MATEMTQDEGIIIHKYTLMIFIEYGTQGGKIPSLAYEYH